VSEELARRLVRLVAQRTGIVLGRERRESIVELCSRRADELRLPGPEDYVRRLEGEQPQDPESLALLTAITNGETSFYRDQAQFAVIESLLAENARRGSPMLHLWSAACSTGEEAYSLSMAALTAQAMVAVLGTDINPGFLGTAQQARYGARALRNLPADHRTRFMAGDPGAWQPTPEVRARVRFQRHNLLDAAVPAAASADGSWDMILCRNVFIYFDRRTIELVVQHLMSALSPNGHLFVGAAESLHGLDVDAVAVNVGGLWAYQRSHSNERRTPAAPILPPPPAVAERRRGASAKPADMRRAPEQLVGFRALREWLGEAPTDAAQKKLAALLEHAPGHIWARLYAGFLALGAGDAAAALDAFQRAHETDPLLPEVHYCLALAYRRLADRVQLAEALRRTVFLAPDFWPALLLQAGLFREVGLNDQAVTTYRRILAVIGMRKSDKALDLDLPDLEDVALYREEVVALCRRSVAELDPGIRSNRSDLP
jgi:chemotaxis protein methyltransferase CheR